MVVNGKGDKKKKSKERAFEVDEEAPVVVFDETIYGIKKHDPNRPRPTKGMNQSSIPRPSEDADEYSLIFYPLLPRSIADMEVDRLWERIKDKVDDIRTSQLNREGSLTT